MKINIGVLKYCTFLKIEIGESNILLNYGFVSSFTAKNAEKHWYIWHHLKKHLPLSRWRKTFKEGEQRGKEQRDWGSLKTEKVKNIQNKFNILQKRHV